MTQNHEYFKDSSLLIKYFNSKELKYSSASHFLSTLQPLPGPLLRDSEMHKL